MAEFEFTPICTHFTEEGATTSKVTLTESHALWYFGLVERKMRPITIRRNLATLGMCVNSRSSTEMVYV